MVNEEKIRAALRGARIARGYGASRIAAARAGQVVLPARLETWTAPSPDTAPSPPRALDWEGCAAGPAEAERLLDALVRAAADEPASHFHLHFWVSESLRHRLDAWLDEGRESWRPIRAIAQDAVSAGINLRPRSLDDAVETAGAFFREPRLGPLDLDSPRRGERILAQLLFALSFGGLGLDRALTILAAGPGDLSLLLGRFGQLAGAFLGDRLAASGEAFAAVQLPEDDPELAMASPWPLAE